ncbi:MAG: hypothetical protein ACK5MF_15800 [Vibrio sp.]|uniref:hypothetical protein n=1 Tax=Vibrio sp. TaxID=678 RepID=UPI003A84F963
MISCHAFYVYVYLPQVDFDDSDVNIDGERSIYSLSLSYHATPSSLGITVIYAF